MSFLINFYTTARPGFPSFRNPGFRLQNPGFGFGKTWAETLVLTYSIVIYSLPKT